MGRFMISSKFCLLGVGIFALAALLALAGCAVASNEYGCDACQDSSWSGEAKLDEIGNPNAGSATSQILPGLSTVQKSRVAKWNQPLHGFADEQKNVSQAAAPAMDRPRMNEAMRSDAAKEMLVPIEDVSETDILLDISESAKEHIHGSIAIPYTEFLINGTFVKSQAELVEILGDAGISRDDSVVIYGECMPCGGGPAPATFAYWIMRSLGQENVRVMDGNVSDWAAAGRPTASDTSIKPQKTYTANVTSEFTATYDYVKSGKAQIVDARTIQEFGAGSIPGSINIPNESVVSGSKIKDEAKLERIFGILNKDQPVVVFTNTGVKASVVWFSLKLLGYDAKLYSYEDWLYHQETEGNATNV